MSPFYDEVDIEDFDYDEFTKCYTYPCPCGDWFEISREMVEAGEDIAICPTCSLAIRVIYDPNRFMKWEILPKIDILPKMEMVSSCKILG
ncbi:hypothetical protein ACH3XW_50050 [Acanthocheilonema viteae]|uniref:Diphthamide biosynthesis protein 3 n=1 Tax=Acanthocheilonema viteae TaxID=6277 RepID=A0A498SKM2_ACAVI|nr:unnamed protein product [Acanthocheilonema viteae]